MKPVRVIPLLVKPGPLQMAIDEWLLWHYRPSEWSVILRFYQWEPAALSLGYGQRQWPDRWQALEWQGKPLPLVRRPTGGRGVLHQGDLCYALVTAPFTSPGGKSNRLETYQTLCRFLQVGWESLGFPLTYGSDRPSRVNQQRCFNCFGLSTPADLRLNNGCKWIGSAQRWRSDSTGSTGSIEVVLQHGSMRLCPDPHLWQQVFDTSFQPPPPEPPIPDPETIVFTLIQAARQCFQTPIITQPLSDEEWCSIEAHAQSIEAHAQSIEAHRAFRLIQQQS